jgi:hypothetical protein
MVEKALRNCCPPMVIHGGATVGVPSDRVDGHEGQCAALSVEARDHEGESAGLSTEVGRSRATKRAARVEARALDRERMTLAVERGHALPRECPTSTERLALSTENARLSRSRAAVAGSCRGPRPTERAPSTDRGSGLSVAARALDGQSPDLDRESEHSRPSRRRSAPRRSQVLDMTWPSISPSRPTRRPRADRRRRWTRVALPTAWRRDRRNRPSPAGDPGRRPCRSWWPRPRPCRRA